VKQAAMKRKSTQETINISEKVEQLKTAIMYSADDYGLAFPNIIVTALKVDDTGNLWFTCPNIPKIFQQFLKEEKRLPVRLGFYRKGIDFNLEICGVACIEGSDTALSENPMIIFKMKMDTIEYREILERKPKNKIGLFLEQGYGWMLRHLAFSNPSPSFPRWHS
jgi:hypothetical protein